MEFLKTLERLRLLFEQVDKFIRGKMISQLEVIFMAVTSWRIDTS
jgi:hypothetical protein